MKVPTFEEVAAKSEADEEPLTPLEHFVMMHWPTEKWGNPEQWTADLEAVLQHRNECKLSPTSTLPEGDIVVAFDLSGEVLIGKYYAGARPVFNAHNGYHSTSILAGWLWPNELWKMFKDNVPPPTGLSR